MSAHHYFRELAYRNPGMIRWLSFTPAVPRLRQIGGQAGGRSHEGHSRSSGWHWVISAASARMSPTDTPVCEARDIEPLLRLNIDTHGDKACFRTASAGLAALIGGALANH